MATYSSTSPYINTAIVNGYLDVYQSVLIPDHPEDVVYTIDKQYEYRPDLVAYDLYGTTALWWVFAVRNPNTIKDPLYDFVSGVTIRIPSKTYLKQLLKF
jgi:hypothetical protein